MLSPNHCFLGSNLLHCLFQSSDDHGSFDLHTCRVLIIVFLVPICYTASSNPQITMVRLISIQSPNHCFSWLPSVTSIASSNPQITMVRSIFIQSPNHCFSWLPSVTSIASSNPQMTMVRSISIHAES